MDASERHEFTSIVRPHFDVLYRTACRLTGNRPDAEDLVQDVCLRVIPNLADLSAADSPRAWLLRVQYRLFIDGKRRRQRSPVRLVDDPAESADSMVSEEPGPDASADASAARRELANAWERLDRNQRALLALHAEGYNLGELASITGISKKALSARLHRARSRLARLLGDSSVAMLRINEQES